ncbi:MAG: shikimate kinase, partial [Alphaproteobacteria bacterium]
MADIAAKVSTDSDQEAIVRRLGDRPLVMVGMMGAGKSSIGKRLASRFGLSFADADAEIELA